MLTILGSVFRNPQRRPAAVIGMTALCLGLSACGQKGPLYLPDRDAPTKAASTPAAPTPASSPVAHDAAPSSR